MAQNKAPVRFRDGQQLVDLRTGGLTHNGVLLLDALWQQVAAGHVTVPVKITQVSVNVLVMKPLLHEVGADGYGTGMTFFGRAAAASTGAVTAQLQGTRLLPSRKVFKTNGTVQAVAGDIVLNASYLFIYHADLDGGAGGFVLK